MFGKKSTTIALVAMMIVVAAAPMLADSSEADTMTEDPEYGITPTFWIGLAIGLAIGGIVGYQVGLNMPTASGTDQEEINLKFRQMEAEKVKTAMDTAKNMISSVLPADTELWSFTTNYWQRAAEYAVCEYWGSDVKYDANAVLQITGLPQNAANYLYSWSEAIDNAYNNLLNQSEHWKNEYSTMALKIVWDNGSMTATNGIASGIDVDTAQFIKPTASKNVVYIDTNYLNPDVNYAYYKNIYAFGSESSYTITNNETGVKYTINKGENNTEQIYNQTTKVSGLLPSGMYTFPSDATFAGAFVRGESATAAEVHGGMVIRNGTVLDYVLSNGDSGVKIYNTAGTLISTSSTLKLTISGGTDATESVLVGNVGNQYYNIVRDYNALVEQIGTVVSKAMVAAETIWQIFDTCEASSLWISPSSVVSSIPGHEVTSAESQAIYIQAMRQIADYYENEVKAEDSWNIVTNVESLSLYCYGDIYYNGSLFAENVVFTPYITNSEQTLNIGKNQWNGKGFAMVWGSEKDFTTSSVSSYALMDLSSGYDVVVDKIVSNGSQKSSITLTPYTISKHDTGSDDPSTPTDVPKVTDTSVFILIMLIELAAILGLIGYITGIQPLFWASGLLAVASAALYWLGWI